MSLAFAAALAQASVPLAVVPIEAAPIAQADPCAGLDRVAAGGPARPVTSRDLAQIADIGRSDPSDPASPFGISPDGRQLAFVLRRGNPAANDYCQQLLVMPLDASAPPVERDRGGAFIREVFELRNFTAVAAGWARVITPRWSPDGQTIAYLKRTGDSTQVWLADPAGVRPAYQATRTPDNVEDFAWMPDGTGLIVATRPALRAEVEAIKAEAAGGYLFDERFSPTMGDQPLPTARHPVEFARWILASGTVTPASPDEAALVTQQRPAGVPAAARIFATGQRSVLAWSEPRSPDQVLSPYRLVMTDAHGKRFTCEVRHCERVTQMWWSPDGGTLLATVRSGWGRGGTSLIAWRIGARAPRTILDTDDMLVGCSLKRRELVCAREGSTLPRRLVGIDTASGRERLVFDPNPAFGTRLQLGRSQRLRFRNAHGIESFADLVLPPDHRSGQRHPLVVVQYNSIGFLRGGTGDEFPIQALAGRGFAVLSSNRPDFVPAARAAPSERAASRAMRQDWIERRSVQSALETAIAQAIATGTVDPARMGISGFSDGTSTVQWALINSRLFKVAALGTCCEGPDTFALAAGPSFEQLGREIGYRFFEPGAPEFWAPMSLVQNADRIDVPILVQTGDSEYETGLDVSAAFRTRGKPFELFVLSGEGHVKWQPAHRFAMYERSVDWFAFWLMGEMDCKPVKAAQYRRWQAMKGAPAGPVCKDSASADP